MARGAGSTFDTVLPIAKELHVAAINWGFVVGKTQTNLPWDSWQHPYVLRDPPIWFHEVLHEDGTPYRQAEVDLIRSLTSKANAAGAGKLKELSLRSPWRLHAGRKGPSRIRCCPAERIRGSRKRTAI